MRRIKERILRRFAVPILVVAVALIFTASKATAATIFESGTLGPTGVLYADLGDAVPGTNVKDSVFVGVRFQLNQRAVTSEIGGHFVASSSGTFFGAIVELDDGNDFPDSQDLVTPDVLGHSLLTFPDPSDEVFADLSLELDPGWYALVFGSGLFGATANGGAVRNGADIGDPTYIVALPTGTGWHDLTFSLPNHRFVVQGEIVPEASGIALASLATLLVLIRARTWKATRSPSSSVSIIPRY